MKTCPGPVTVVFISPSPPLQAPQQLLVDIPTSKVVEFSHGRGSAAAREGAEREAARRRGVECGLRARCFTSLALSGVAELALSGMAEL
jgi:hypothetical protein